jgi:anti-sigma factor RsiW
MPGPCRAFLTDFSAFVDGELSTRRRDEIQAHVDCCQACLDHLTAYRRGITVLRSIEAEAPADFWTRLEQRLWLGPELSVLEGGAGQARKKPAARWSMPAAWLAAAAVLTLFVVARGLGPGSGSVAVGPERIQASVAMTLPAVPPSDPVGTASDEQATSRVAATGGRSTNRQPVARGRTEPALAWVDARGESSIEREIRRFEERILEGGLRRGAGSTLAADGWVQPVRLGGDRFGSGIRPASLVRPAVAITPAPWNVDRAVSLP